MQRASIIDDLIEVVKRSDLNRKQIADALKTLGCLNYIRNHLDLIARAVDDRDNLSFYRFPHDREKGVLRDDKGTSFHIDGFKNGVEARESLLKYIDYIESLLQALTAAQRIVFASRLQFEKDSGCLPRRLGSSVMYAEEVVGDRITLNSIMNCAMQIARRQQLPLCAMAVRYFQDNFITHAVYNGNKILLNEAVILQYMADVLCESPDYIPQAEDPVAKFQTLCDEYKPNIVMGRAGMVQLHFTSQEAGREFAETVKQLDVLQGSGIEKARCKKELRDGKERYILRLTQTQYALVRKQDWIKTPSDPTHLSQAKPQALAATLSLPTLLTMPRTSEESAKAAVLSIETAILQKPNWTHMNLFKRKTTSNIPTRTASEILKIVNETRRSNDQDAWQKARVKVCKKLNAAHFLRDEDTKAFYDSLKKPAIP